MSNFTMNAYNLKRDLFNFSKKIYEGLSKPESKFISDMFFGISSSGTVLISEIARALKEKAKLPYTIERLCDHLASFDNEEIIFKNYYKTILPYVPDEPVVLFDDSDITKTYGKKFEDLDLVVDASSPKKEVKPGYHVCEAVVLGKNEKQPFSLYSKIYSTKSEEFKSTNDYTMKSINKCVEVLNRKFTGVFDRGYDDNKIFDYMDKTGNSFVIRLKDNRNFKFKGKIKNVYEEAIKRKGKIGMDLWFDNNEVHTVYISHTKVTLPHNNKDYELVLCYGLSDDKPLMLLTNKEIHSKDDVIKIVRLYFSRWRIEEYFRGKKQEYDFENLRVRTLKSINNLNTILTIYLSFVEMCAEEMNNKLLSLKIIEESKSLRKKVVIWLSQIAKGIKNILSYCHTGIREWESVETRDKYKQLSLKL